ncbi:MULTISPECIES: SMP-30/gluconolactonase/LRE family protein [unclassified Rhizobium]|uniref:SMP-30/gluconolactonase/LRE family protein n=1 Tax=unclassified Rhizobium TaxID=2613769 RepID=UPI001611D9BC|nr:MULTISPECIES: SMP-30/gluconolactonase/LRE family protein [unclassified Rhizobium]MBB3287583.1 gluconolactonase [Rhizobium sp. BK252]MBB3402323.1 gluconolactonase [Rhizobium sp. BK289]MBB3414900.1 gluconolactonase [Rhizobium sp. BK284]MBB3482789.1 gluconolactonase [Rhizobium sp. BK347]MDK4721863.1 SMP-30/gluconolactonase/LRE family protein [Rhizobium sp. CNPSo 3968]
MNETIATGLRLPGGLVALPDGRIALVETDPSRRYLKLFDTSGACEELCRIGGSPTGIAIDGDGCFWVAGGPENSLIKLSPQGRIRQVIEGSADGPFLHPNALAFGPDGLLYMTDSGIRLTDLLERGHIHPDFFKAAYNGCVYQIDPSEGRVIRVLAAGLLLASGIAFGPDGLLYYSETLTGKIHRQIVGGRQEMFAQSMRSPAVNVLRGPSGLAFDRSGTLYCAMSGLGEICLIDREGMMSGHIRTNGTRPSGIAFTVDGKHLLVGEQEKGVIEKITAPRLGLPLHMPSIS